MSVAPALIKRDTSLTGAFPHGQDLRRLMRILFKKYFLAYNININQQLGTL